MVYLGIGSNLGNSPEIVERTAERLSCYLENIRVSSLYLTSPRDYVFQPDFINCVVCGNFTASPLELLDITQGIEEEAGRKRSFKNAARILDIDILLFDDQLMDSDLLSIPHPRIRFRKFVLVPMLELDWSLIDPRRNIPYAGDLLQLPPQGIYYMDLKRYSNSL